MSGGWPAEAGSLAGVRQLMRRWLRAQGATDGETDDIVVACQEACTNAVEHAYRPGDHTFALDATYEAGRVRVRVQDDGRWRPPRGAHRGRGLPMMRELMDSVEVTHGAEGTVVVMERALGRKGR